MELGEVRYGARGRVWDYVVVDGAYSSMTCQDGCREKGPFLVPSHNKVKMVC